MLIFRAFGHYNIGTLSNEAIIIIYYYLVPCCLALTPKYMNLNGHFTLNFHYYDDYFQRLFYILTIEPQPKSN